MARARVHRVLQRAWNVGQVAGLAVPVAESRENTADLEVALHTHEVEPAQELRFVTACRQPGC